LLTWEELGSNINLPEKRASLEILAGNFAAADVAAAAVVVDIAPDLAASSFLVALLHPN